MFCFNCLAVHEKKMAFPHEPQHTWLLRFFFLRHREDGGCRVGSQYF